MPPSNPPYDETTANPEGEIVGSEQILTLWKKFNNVINALPGDLTSEEQIFYKENLLSDNILNKSIPIQLVNNGNPTIEILNLDGSTFDTGPSYISSNFTVDELNSYFDAYFSSNSSANSLNNYKCVIPGYDYLEFYYKCECYPANTSATGSSAQYQTWFIPMPNATIASLKSNPNQTNLLTNTVKKLYDPTLGRYTYDYKIFLKNTSTNSYVPKDFGKAVSFYAFIFEDAGVLSFFGGIRSGSNVELNANNVEVKNVDGFRPRLSYIRYVGNTGFDNVEMSGNIKITGTLDLSNNYTYNDLSDSSYNVINLKQLEEWYSTKGGTGGISIDGSYVLDASLNDYSLDLSINNVDISEHLTVNGNVDINGKISLNGDYGTTNQVLVSNGLNSSVTWKNQISYSNGTGVSINGSNEISIGQDVGINNGVIFNSITSDYNYSSDYKSKEKSGLLNAVSGQWTTIATFMQNYTTNTWRSAEIIIEEAHSPPNGGDKGGGIWIGNFTYNFHNNGGRIIQFSSFSRISGHGGGITFQFVALSNNNASSGARLEVYNHREIINIVKYKFKFHALDNFTLS